MTHSNALGTDLHLRIATELFLKRAVVGGIERVFEIGPVFRNEGIDSTHSPEYTMLELYQSYADYDAMATLTHELVQEAAVALSGSHIVTLADGSEFDVGGQWRSVTLYGALSDALGAEVTVTTPMGKLVGYADQHELTVAPHWARASSPRSCSNGWWSRIWLPPRSYVTIRRRPVR